MNSSTLTFDTHTVNTTETASPRIITFTKIQRTLVVKWDLYAVISQMASSAAYGVYALAHCGLN